jgi:hypothetical protein
LGGAETKVTLPFEHKLARSVGLVVAVSAAADDSKLAPEFRNETTGNPVKVIVQFNVLPADREQSEVRSYGGSILASLQVVQGLEVSLPANRLAALSDEWMFFTCSLPAATCVDF